MLTISFERRDFRIARAVSVNGFQATSLFENTNNKHRGSTFISFDANAR